MVLQDATLHKSFETSNRQPLGLSIAEANKAGDGAAIQDVADWKDPTPVREELLPVKPLTPKMVPEPFRAFVWDIAERMQVPPDIAWAATVVMLGSVIGTACTIKPKRYDDWTVVPNTWGAAVARPGIVMKSPAFESAMEPLNQLELEELQRCEARQREYAAACAMHEAQEASLKAEMKKAAAPASGSKYKQAGKSPIADIEILKEQFENLVAPQQPVRRRYLTRDTTVPKVCELLVSNQRGLLLPRDELKGWLISLDAEGREEDRTFYMEAFNGTGSYGWDRIGRGTGYVPHLCLSVFGGTQPDRWAELVSKAMKGNNDGLIQRFQVLVYPDTPIDWENIDRTPNKLAKDRASRIVRTLAYLEFTEHGATKTDCDRFAYLRFSQDAQPLFDKWFTELHKSKLKNEDEHPIFVEHLTKYKSLLPSLALIYHLVDVADGRSTGSVSKGALESAFGYIDYLESHARRAYDLGLNVGAKAAAKLAAQIRSGKLPTTGFTIRDVKRKGWSLLDDNERIKQACEELIEAGWLRTVIPDRAIIYLINPKILEPEKLKTAKPSTAKTDIDNEVSVLSVGGLGISEKQESLAHLVQASAVPDLLALS